MKSIDLVTLQKLSWKAVECESLNDDHLDHLFNWSAGIHDPRAYYRFLYFLMRETRPNVSVELGTGSGRAAAHMAGGHPDGAVYTVDVADSPSLFANIKPYPNVRFILGDSIHHEVLDIFTESSVGVCFLDSVHTYDHIIKEVKLWTPKMAEGGVIVIDDLAWSEETKRVMNDIPFKEKIFLPNMQGTKGFGHSLVGFGCAIAR